ncbi:DUF1549 and DUF1553 domain-containing protein [bacterium]|nr:DUF1549 and DUF1553 domain-containing protein [bacterium]
MRQQAIGWMLIGFLLASSVAAEETAATGLSLDVGAIKLMGPRSYQQSLATATLGDGSLRDVTTEVEWSSTKPEIAQVSPTGLVVAKSNGEGELVARLGSLEARTTIHVDKFEQPSPILFTEEVVPALTRSGCNSGACHGTPSGKNGFRLSLQGYLPDQDFLVLTREAVGRRINRLEPDQSLLLNKGVGRVPHDGGRRFGPENEAFQVVRQWIAEGAAPPTDQWGSVVRLEVTPGLRVLRAPAKHQQIVVRAHFAGGAVRDVTPLVLFSSSDPSIAKVSKSGRVTFLGKGSAAILCRYLHLVDNAKLTHLTPTPGFVWSQPATAGEIDRLVFAKLEELQILPSDLCSDAEFVRRVHLDAIGVLPSPERVRSFLADTQPDTQSNRRTALIDEVLARPEYAKFWGLKWADVLRSTRKQVSYRGAHHFRRYLNETFAANKPFDQFVKELVTATGDPAVVPAANFYRVSRDPMECAESTAQLFMGVRMQCAKCHNHPFERWTQDDYYGLAACFARVGRKKTPSDVDKEVIFIARGGEVTHLRTGKVMSAKAPGSSPFAESADRRQPLADWLASPANPYFAKSVVNRVWYHLLGKGIVDPVDDFRDSNPPRNEPLLNHLSTEFEKNKYDFRQLVRSILLSRTYQLSARTDPTNAEDEKYFSHAYSRLLPAEVLLDALSTSTAVAEKYAGLPTGTTAVDLPDPEVSHEFLRAFGQPSREIVCECGRESDTTLSQALHLINGDVIHQKLRSPDNRVHAMLKAGTPPASIVEELYLASLSRMPTSAEQETAAKHIAKVGDPSRALEDLHWAILNSKEFLFRH